MTTEPGDSNYIDVGKGQEPPSDIDAIQADIAQTRAELTDTVEQVADHLNPKTQARKQAASAKHAAADTAAHLKAAAPEPVRHGVDTITEKAGPPAARVNAALAPHRAKIAAGATGLLVVVLIIRRRRSRS